MAKWRYFVASIAAERRRRWPLSIPVKYGTYCRRHHHQVGAYTGICADCHREAWDWTAAQYGDLGSAPRPSKEEQLDEQFQTALELDD